MTEDVKFIEYLVSLDYAVRTPPVQRRFGEQMDQHRILGHRCPSCRLVYVPPKGFCPLCVVATTEEDEVEVADRGTITSFTVLTPIQYRGQKEREDYVLASILLDGADSTIGQQRIEGIANDQVRMGMRVSAAWAAPDERSSEEVGGRFGLGDAVKHWVPTGEPDADPELYREHVL